ncbi:uncharacterized protein LOC117180084 [Belonocnema kinseyi]|uniref:uncharacterized protein LOC117180084 n=1 Tax=Belonocnema kinseyi TaxID=2817044 RepID=UPI00143D2D31|nr:uncharacterized protein LOC117180084 [Belonocnema kinseyi]
MKPIFIREELELPVKSLDSEKSENMARFLKTHFNLRNKLAKRPIDDRLSFYVRGQGGPRGRASDAVRSAKQLHNNARVYGKSRQYRRRLSCRLLQSFSVNSKNVAGHSLYFAFSHSVFRLCVA